MDGHGFTMRYSDNSGFWTVGNGFVEFQVQNHGHARAAMLALDLAWSGGQESVWRGLSKAAGVPLPWNGDVQANGDAPEATE